MKFFSPLRALRLLFPYARAFNGDSLASRLTDTNRSFICSASHKQSTVASTTPAMSTIDSYLKALLALSGDEQLVSPRHALLQSLNDADLAGFVKKIVGREFARSDLEDIASVLLDTIVKSPAPVHSHAAREDQATPVKAETDIDRETTPAPGKLGLCRALIVC
jgi:hypothetical protein